MSDDRNRISITLTDAERAEIDAVASVLGIKATRVVYECTKVGLTLVLEAGQKKKNQIELAQFLKNQSDWTDQPKTKAKAEKPRTNNQRKQDAKKKKSR